MMCVFLFKTKKVLKIWFSPWRFSQIRGIVFKGHRACVQGTAQLEAYGQACVATEEREIKIIWTSTALFFFFFISVLSRSTWRIPSLAPRACWSSAFNLHVALFQPSGFRYPHPFFFVCLLVFKHLDDSRDYRPHVVRLKLGTGAPLKLENQTGRSWRSSYKEPVAVWGN